MATIYAPPTGFDPPEIVFTDGRYDHDATEAAEADFVTRLTAEARRVGNAGDLVGEIIRFPVADGYAQYLVWKERPLELVHLALGDAWSIPASHARGIRLADVRQHVEASKAMQAIFQGNQDWWDAQALGTVVHYDNGFGQFVRGVIVDDGGERKMQPTALVGHVITADTPVEDIREHGGWRDHEVARRTAYGDVDYGYHAKHVLTRESMRPHPGNIVESPDYSGSKLGVDPREMEPIDFDSLLPQPDDDRLAAEALCRLVNRIAHVCNRGNDREMDDRARIAEVRRLVIMHPDGI